MNDGLREPAKKCGTKQIMIAHIVAAAKNGVIGKGGKLPWHIPDDMKWFRERTRGSALIMGRKTFEAVEHPLPNRLNVVVTRQKNYRPKIIGNESHPTKPNNSPVHIVATIEEAIAYCKELAPKYHNEIFIIGGGEIYRQSIQYVDTIFLTRVHRDYDGDAFYPDPDVKQFRRVEKQDHTSSPGASNDTVSFSFETWVRK